MKNHVHGGDVYRYRNFLDFSSNCNPLGTPESVKRAIAEAAESVGNYPDVRCEELKSAIGAYEGVAPERIFCGNGAAEVIFSLCLAKKPKTALMPAPTFAEYEQALESVGCAVEFYDLPRESGFVPDGGFLRTIRERRPEMVFFCNPNNPTGVLAPRDYMEEMYAACKSAGSLLAADECFLDFVAEPEAYTMKSHLTEGEGLFLLKAFTKRYAMAGVRLGYGLCGDTDLLERMRAVTQPWNVSTLAQRAGVAALGEKEYVEFGRQLVFAEREYLAEGLAGLGFQLFDSAANYLFFRGPAGLSERMKEHQVLIRDCGNYRNLGQGYYRVAVRTHEENARLLDALAACIDEI